MKPKKTLLDIIRSQRKLCCNNGAGNQPLTSCGTKAPTPTAVIRYLHQPLYQSYGIYTNRCTSHTVSTSFDVPVIRYLHQPMYQSYGICTNRCTSHTVSTPTAVAVIRYLHQPLYQSYGIYTNRCYHKSAFICICVL